MTESLVKNLKLVGLIGKSGSGKTRTAASFSRHLTTRTLYCSEPIKRAVANIFDWPIELLRGETENGRLWRDEHTERLPNGKSITPRQALQQVGSLMRYEFGPDIWLTQLRLRIWPSAASASRETRMAVIPDIRRWNEAELVRQNQGLLVRVTPAPGNARPTTKAIHEHPSETELDGFPTDWEILNGPDAYLDRQVADLLNQPLTRFGLEP